MAVLINTFIGYPFSNVLLFKILPVNELLLLAGLIAISKEIKTIFTRYDLLRLLVLWFFLFLPRAVLDFALTKNIWILRDAMPLIEIGWIFLAVYLAERLSYEKIVDLIVNAGMVLIPAKFIIVAFKPWSSKLVIHGLQRDIPFLVSVAGFGLLVIFVCLSLIFNNKGWRRYIGMLLFLFFLVTIQSRLAYLVTCLILMFLLALDFYRYAGKIFAGILLFLLFASFIARFGFLNSVARFGIKMASPSHIVAHIASGFGVSLSPELKGQAGGVGQRLNWWSVLIKKILSDPGMCFWGMGFGYPLTDLKLGSVKIREPHNSYLSVWARTGLLGLFLWLWAWIGFFLRLTRYVISFYRQNLYFNKMFAFWGFFLFVLVGSLVEPFFEMPFEATVIYIFMGIAMVALKQAKEQKGFVLDC